MEYYFHLLIAAGIWSVLGLSFNLVAGTAGLLSFAQAALYALGAYTSALASRAGAPLWLSIFLGAIVGAMPSLLAYFRGFSLDRSVFIVGTFALQLVITDALRNLKTLTGGTQGLPGLDPLANGLITQASVVIGLTALVTVTALWLSSTSLSRRVRAAREDERFAESLGIDIVHTRMAVLAIGGAMAGLAGGLMTHYFTYIDPTFFGVDESVLIAIMVLIGGLDSVAGAIAGALLVVFVPELFRQVGLPVGIAAAMRQLLFGLTLILVLAFRPRGIFGRFEFDGQRN